MVSQDLIYSVLPRQTGQVELKNRIVEKVVKRSSLKTVEENESSPSEPTTITPKRRRGDRRQGDRRATVRADENVTTRGPQPSAPSADDDKIDSLDIFV
jgi:hypothetical protein